MKITHLFIACLLLASCSKKSGNGTDGDGKWGEQPALPVVTGQQTFDVGADVHYVNVMGNTTPRMPNFPTLAVKAGIARGYVADLSGKPLKGANISVSSTLIGGWYSSGTAQTDDNGYYEFTIPAGAAYFFGTATTISYGQTNTVVALYPAGGTTSFPSGSGVVKNFVLLSYGPANPDEVAQQPGNSANYYGGAIRLSFLIDYSGGGTPGYLPLGGQLSVELIPDGPGLYGENKSFKINKIIGNNLNFNIVNIPVGKYTIKAKINGSDLKMTETAHTYPNLGLKPNGAIGTSTVLFIPVAGYTPVKVPSFKGNWETLTVRIETQ